jgi:hypothetical protein
MVADEKEAPLVARRLFVGDGGEDEVALQVGLLAREEGDDARAHRRHVLHVDGPAPPEPAVVDLAGERGVLPASRVRLDDVEVRVQKERAALGPVAVVPLVAFVSLAWIALQARDEVRAPRGLLEEARLDPRLTQVLGDSLRRGALVSVPRLVRAAVDRRDPKEVLQKRYAAVPLRSPIDRLHAMCLARMSSR